MRTDRGEFAVHAMHGDPGVLADRLDRVLALERAAADAGVPLATPVPDPRTGTAAALLDGEPVVVHHWVDAPQVDLDRSPPALYRHLGASVAAIHGLDRSLAPGTRLTHLPDEARWRSIAEAAHERGLPWAGDLRDGAAGLAAASAVVEGWDRDAAEPDLVGHRDLTSMNLLDRDGTPVLIDWEDAGPIGAGDELGRTALDNLGRNGVFDDDLLRTFLEGYAEVRPLPPVGPHWCNLWIRGLVIFGEHCARSCIEGTADESLLRLQSDVVAWLVPELQRRLDAVPRYVGSFEKASRSSS